MDHRDPIETGKKFGGYADAITAFAILQSLAFLSAVASNAKDGMTNPLAMWMVLLDLASALYVIALVMCYRAESALLGKLDGKDPVATWTRRFRWLRIMCVLLAFLITNIPVIIWLLSPSHL